MINPKVSVVIPAYNHEAYLEAAVRSVILQTYKPTEIIILNDGSTDLTGDICEKLAGEYSTIRYFTHFNMGAHNTINKGIDLALGQYIAVLNSDDIFFPEKIERCIELVHKDESLELICGNVEFINGKGDTQASGVSKEWQRRGYSFYDETGLLPLSTLNENFIATTSNMFFSKKIWKKVGGFQALRYCHDLDFLMASYRSGAYYFDREHTHIKYRVHEANTIKEDLTKIRLEIATVIAASLVLDNSSLLGEVDAAAVVKFISLLNNKNMSNIIILMMMEFLRIGDRRDYYDHYYNMDTKKIFAMAIE